MTTDLSRGLDDRHTLRLRGLIESWEQQGLIGHEVAARALAAKPERSAAVNTRSPGLRRLELFGYLGALPATGAGLLLAGSQLGAGPLLLIGLLIAIASPRAIRTSQRHATTSSRRKPDPRHRVGRPEHSRGPKTHQVMLNGHSGQGLSPVTVAPSSSN